MPLDLFSKSSIPDVLPDEMQKIVDEIKKSSGKEECLKKTYEILIAKYHGSHGKTYTKLIDVFEHDIGTLWSKSGFMHCTNINYVLRTLLIKSDFFKDEDICLKWTLVWYISPHQYVKVRVDNRWVDVDIWAYAYGIKFGDYAHGFH